MYGLEKFWAFMKYYKHADELHVDKKLKDLLEPFKTIEDFKVYYTVSGFSYFSPEALGLMLQLCHVLNITCCYCYNTQEEEVQGRRSRNPSFSKSINPPSLSGTRRNQGRRSRTASEGDSWTVTADGSSSSHTNAGVQPYVGRHSSGGMGSSNAVTRNNPNSRGGGGVGSTRGQLHKVCQSNLCISNCK